MTDFMAAPPTAAVAASVAAAAVPAAGVPPLAGTSLWLYVLLLVLVHAVCW